MANEKFQLIIEAKEAASAKIAALKNQLADLGGPEMVKSQKEINKLTREINSLSGEAKSGHGFFGRFAQSVAIGTLAAQAATAALSAMKNAFVDTFEKAAESQVVMSQLIDSLSRHKMATTENIDAITKFASKMQFLTGVADEEYLRAVNEMIDRGASLSQSLKLTELAADAAASRHVDLATTIKEFANAVGKESLVKLEKYGILINLNATFANQLDSAIQQLTVNVGGAALAASDSFTVRLNAMKESFGDLQEKIGTAFMPVLIEVFNTLTMFFDTFATATFGRQFDAQGNLIISSGGDIISMLQSAQGHMTGWVNIIVGGARVIINAFQVLGDAIRVSMSPGVDITIALSQALAGDFSGAMDTVSGITDNMADEMANMVIQMFELKDSWSQMTTGFGQVSGGATDSPVVKTITDMKAAATAANDEIRNTFVGMAPIVEDAADTVQFEFTLATNSVRATISATSVYMNRLSQQMGQILGQGLSSMVDRMVYARGSFAEIFKGMAQDFMSYFIKSAISALVSHFLPGIGGFFGSVLGGFFGGGGSSGGASGAPAGSSPFGAPALAGGAGRGTVLVNINMTGNVLSEEYIAHTVAPTVQRAVLAGQSTLAIQGSNKTGTRNVRIK